MYTRIGQNDIAILAKWLAKHGQYILKKHSIPMELAQYSNVNCVVARVKIETLNNINRIKCNIAQLYYLHKYDHFSRVTFLGAS